jgi:hypothetical protein
LQKDVIEPAQSYKSAAERAARDAEAQQKRAADNAANAQAAKDKLVQAQSDVASAFDEIAKALRASKGGNPEALERAAARMQELAGKYRPAHEKMER